MIQNLNGVLHSSSFFNGWMRWQFCYDHGCQGEPVLNVVGAARQDSGSLEVFMVKGGRVQVWHNLAAPGWALGWLNSNDSKMLIAWNHEY